MLGQHADRVAVEDGCRHALQLDRLFRVEPGMVTMIGVEPELGANRAFETCDLGGSVSPRGTISSAALMFHAIEVRSWLLFDGASVIGRLLSRLPWAGVAGGVGVPARSVGSSAPSLGSTGDCPPNSVRMGAAKCVALTGHLARRLGLLDYRLHTRGADQSVRYRVVGVSRHNGLQHRLRLAPLSRGSCWSPYIRRGER